MKYQDVQNLTDEQIVHRELQLERDMISLRFLHRTQQLEDSSKLGKLRKDIARLRTAQSAREHAQGLHPNTLRDRYRTTFQAASSSVGADASSGFLQGMATRIGVGGDDQDETAPQE